MKAMREEPIVYPSGKLNLEGLFAENSGQKGAVICHPHPQLGGSMQNNVVVSLITALFFHAFSTLRFNFRGVGNSKGAYDNGIGEQEDIEDAVAWIRQKGKTEILLAGYSFGSWVSAKWLRNHDLEQPAILISPPIQVMDFDFSSLAGKVGLVVCAENDQYCSPEKMREIAGQINCRFEVIPEADHFYFGCEGKMIAALNRYLAQN